MRECPGFAPLVARFRIEEQAFGLGAFSQVYAAVELSGEHDAGRLVAIKAVSKQRFREATEADDTAEDGRGWLEQMRDEAVFLGELAAARHRNLLRFLGAWEDDTHLYLVTSFAAGGELVGWLEQQVTAPGSAGYTETLCAKIVYDLLQALRHCHALGIVHRDVKPANLLLSSSDFGANLKLADWGLAARWAEGGPALAGVCGTLDYSSPEMLNGSYTNATDLWSAGVLLFSLLSGRSPFRGPSAAATAHRVKAGRVDLRSPLLRPASAEARALLGALLLPEGRAEGGTRSRPTAMEALHHPWLRQRVNTEAARPLPAAIPGRLAQLAAQKNWHVGETRSPTSSEVQSLSDPSRDPSGSEGALSPRPRSPSGPPRGLSVRQAIDSLWRSSRRSRKSRRGRRTSQADEADDEAEPEGDALLGDALPADCPPTASPKSAGPRSPAPMSTPRPPAASPSKPSRALPSPASPPRELQAQASQLTWLHRAENIFSDSSSDSEGVRSSDSEGVRSSGAAATTHASAPAPTARRRLSARPSFSPALRSPTPARRVPEPIRPAGAAKGGCWPCGLWPRRGRQEEETVRIPPQTSIQLSTQPQCVPPYPSRALSHRWRS